MPTSPGVKSISLRVSTFPGVLSISGILLSSSTATVLDGLTSLGSGKSGTFAFALETDCFKILSPNEEGFAKSASVSSSYPFSFSVLLIKSLPPSFEIAFWIVPFSFPVSADLPFSSASLAAFLMVVDIDS